MRFNKNVTDDDFTWNKGTITHNHSCSACTVNIGPRVFLVSTSLAAPAWSLLSPYQPQYHISQSRPHAWSNKMGVGSRAIMISCTYTCLALWKHHVNLLLQSFRSIARIFISVNNNDKAVPNQPSKLYLMDRLLNGQKI